MNRENLFGDNEYLLILSKLVAEEKLLKSDLLRLIKAREFDCSKKPFANFEQQIKYIGDISKLIVYGLKLSNRVQ